MRLQYKRAIAQHTLLTRLCNVALAFLLLFSLLPTNAFANEATENQSAPIVVEQTSNTQDATTETEPPSENPDTKETPDAPESNKETPQPPEDKTKEEPTPPKEVVAYKAEVSLNVLFDQWANTDDKARVEITDGSGVIVVEQEVALNEIITLATLEEGSYTLAISAPILEDGTVFNKIEDINFEIAEGKALNTFEIPLQVIPTEQMSDANIAVAVDAWAKTDEEKTALTDRAQEKMQPAQTEIEEEKVVVTTRSAAPATYSVVEPDYTGTAYVYCANKGTGWDDGDLFDVTMPDGQVIRGYCINPGLSYPVDGWYPFTGVWNGSSYDITVWSWDATPGGLLGTPCQNVGNFQWLPKEYMDPGAVLIQKYDAETNSTTPQNGLTFEGAEFTLTNTDSKKTWVIELNQYGTGYHEDIPLGDYTLVETKAPAGYDLDPTVHSFSIGTPASGTNTISIKAYDRLQKGGIAINKTIVGGEIDLAGIRFNIIDKATSEEVTTITLNEKGYATTGLILPYGHYQVVEDVTSLPETIIEAGLSLYPDNIVVDDVFMQGNVTFDYDVTNYAKTSATVLKTSHDGQDKVADTDFTLYRQESDEWVELETATTDTDGVAKFSEGIIDQFGTYKIKETANNSDYMTDADAGMSNERIFEVNADTYENVYSFEFVNYKKIDLNLIKVDGDAVYGQNPDLLINPENIDPANVKKIEGATYTLSREDNGAWVDLETTVTDANGIAKFSNNIVDQFGTYRITETLPANVDSNDGYMWPTDSRQSAETQFVVDATTYDKIANQAKENVDGYGYAYDEGDTNPLVTITAINWLYRDIEVVKQDEDTHQGVEGTEFTLYRYIGEGVPAEYTDQDSRGEHPVTATDPSSPVDPASWEVVSTQNTQANGTLLFRGLTFGYYLVVETMPSVDYAFWYESANSSWDRYCFSVDETAQKQTQVFENMKITLETNVFKSTIARTSAAFTSPWDNWNNVNIETYRYDIGFNNGATNVRADQYSVQDACEFTAQGLRIQSLWTPIVINDTDGTYNIKYRTNLSNGTSSVSATATNPQNALADGTDRIDASSWHDWASNVSCSTRTQLDVSDLGLAEGEYITGIMLEFGSVEQQFTTTTSMTYTVSATEALDFNGDATEITNSVTSHITRNWHNNTGLTDDDYDEVVTRVIGSFVYGGSTNTRLAQTGDTTPAAALQFVMFASVLALALLYMQQRKKGGLVSSHNNTNDHQDKI